MKVKTLYSKKRLFQIALLSICLIGCPLTVLGNDKNLEKLAKIEKTLYFKTYGDETIEKRLNRLEKRFFGEAASGDSSKRVDKIYELVKEQIEDAEKAASSPPPATSDVQYPETTRETKTNFEDPDKETNEKRLAVLKARDEEITNLLKEGISFWESKKAKQAEERFHQAIRLDPRNAEAFFSLGVIYEAEGKLDKALKSYERANYFNPDRMDFKRAIVSLQEKIKVAGSIDPLEKEAQNAFKRKEYMSAIDLYKRLESKYPEKALYKYNLGTINLIMKNPEIALEYYQKSNQLAPQDQKFKQAYEKLKATMDASRSRRQVREAELNKYENQKKMAQPNNPVPPGGNPMLQAMNYLKSIGVGTQPTPAGIKINTVVIGSKAAKSGIRPGDIIISVNGRSMENPIQLASMLSSQKNGMKAQLIIKRQGQVGQILF